MPRQIVRQALVTWLSNGDIPSLNHVHLTYPRRLDFSAYGTGPNRCQVVVFVRAEGERRIALGGALSGKKRIDYRVDLEVYHHSVAREPVEAMTDFDAVIDAIKAQVRANRTLNDSSGTILQAGEGQYGIQVSYAQPKQVSSEAIETWASLTFEVTEITNS
uniref:hypothetical protein n=1 Tax=Pseudonocardia sp. CA-138482 TaxID=3240023 RepID=UPI003F4959E2